MRDVNLLNLWSRSSRGSTLLVTLIVCSSRTAANGPVTLATTRLGDAGLPGDVLNLGLTEPARHQPKEVTHGRTRKTRPQSCP